MIRIGDVYALKTGEALRIEGYDPEFRNEFVAQVRNQQGVWTEYRITGEAIKLPFFLKQMKAVRELH